MYTYVAYFCFNEVIAFLKMDVNALMKTMFIDTRSLKTSFFKVKVGSSILIVFLLATLSTAIQNTTVESTFAAEIYTTDPTVYPSTTTAKVTSDARNDAFSGDFATLSLENTTVTSTFAAAIYTTDPAVYPSTTTAKMTSENTTVTSTFAAEIYTTDPTVYPSTTTTKLTSDARNDAFSGDFATLSLENATVTSTFAAAIYTTDPTVYPSTTTAKVTSASCVDVICDGCSNCVYDKAKICVCKCISGYKQNTLGQCEAVLCPEEMLNYPNTPGIVVTFPFTQAGYSNASVDTCPDKTSNDGLPYGSRVCTLSGLWLAPNWLSSCDTNAQSYIGLTFNTTEERQVAADDLNIITSDPSSLNADDITTTVQALDNVMDAENLDKNTSSSVVATIGNLLGVSEKELQQSGQAVNLMQTLDSVGEKVELNAGEEFQTVSSTVAIGVVQGNSTGFNSGIGYKFYSLSTPTELGFRSDQLGTFYSSKPDEQASSYIVLPFEVLMQRNRTSFYAFLDDKLFRASTATGTYSGNDYIGSEVILSASVVNATKAQNLETPVVLKFTFTPNACNLTNVERMCAFWNENENGFWSSEGLIQQNITNETAECHFNHLTDFATLFSTTSISLPGSDLITIVGSSISAACLILLVIIFTFSRKLKAGKKFRSAFLLVNLGIALLIFNVSMIVSEQPSVQKSGCEVIAVFIHFSLLASLAWMMVEGVVIYINVVHGIYARVHVTDRKMITSSLLWGWLMPLIFVAVVAGVDMDNYSREDAEYFTYSKIRLCWLRQDLVVFLVVIPAALILGINLILYISILTFILFRPRPRSSNRKSDVCKNVVLSVTLFVTVGGTWLFGFAIPGTRTYDENASNIFAYIFTISNALQGFFLFVLYVVRQHFTVDIFKQVINKTFYPISKYPKRNDDHFSGTEKQQKASHINDGIDLQCKLTDFAYRDTYNK
ncbi:adhesion G-protein coupled receptor G7-like isoform X2 [Clavelina lepadiformis]|uniref:adhesion G-protein coupled receptor G7-like isoform X2 n=1 Tax=Clavelina lepadiformis TaxID=159417 RepID=UPI0040412F8E